MITTIDTRKIFSNNNYSNNIYIAFITISYQLTCHLLDNSSKNRFPTNMKKENTRNATNNTKIIYDKLQSD